MVNRHLLVLLSQLEGSNEPPQTALLQVFVHKDSALLALPPQPQACVKSND
jgi:hypothetical protein